MRLAVLIAAGAVRVHRDDCVPEYLSVGSLSALLPPRST
jgi:hypothetical protein